MVHCKLTKMTPSTGSGQAQINKIEQKFKNIVKKNACPFVDGERFLFEVRAPESLKGQRLRA